MFLTYASGAPGTSLRSVYRRAPAYETSFHWLEAGRDNDEVLVLLHGILAHGFAFRKVVDSLAEHHHVIVPDLPGHGRDKTFRSPGVEPTISGLLDWFETLLETAVGDRPYSLVGHSLGALLCFIAGREYERFEPIRKIALVSPGIRIGAPQWLSSVIDLVPSQIASVGATQWGLRLYEPVQWRVSRMSDEEAEAYLAPLKEQDRLDFILNLGSDLMAEPDRLPGAHRVDVPTLIITGAEDHLLPLEDVRLLQSVIPDSRLHVFEGVGHCPMEDTPERFTRVLLDFLAES